jgi:hypothetical protein
MLGSLIRSGAIVVLALIALAPTAAAAPPGNDNFAQAGVLGGPPDAATGTVREATREAGEPPHAEEPAPNTVWYTFTAAADERVALSTCGGAEFDTVIAVYTGDAVGTLTPVAQNDDACGPVGLQSRLTFVARTGQTYRIAVASLFELQPEQTGDFTLRVDEALPPANDAFADARRVRVPGRFTGSTFEARRELGEPRHLRGQSGKSVWFRFRARRTGPLTFDTNGSGFDTVLAVYRGRRLGRLRRVKRNDDAGVGLASRLRFRARRGATYSIAIDGFGGGAGEYVLNLSDGSVRAVGPTLAVEGGQTLDSVRARGLRAQVSCRRACRLRLDALVSRRIARRLRLGRRVIARGGGSLVGGGPAQPATLAPLRGGRRALRATSRLRLLVRATLLGTTALDRSVSRRITLTG